MPRLAWFSPVRPIKSGISQYNHELLPALVDDYDIDVFVDGPAENFVSPEPRVALISAYDFVWRHSCRPYHLCVYQLGNARCHDYMWAYLVRYPGLTVLHDGQLHHARARMLLQQRFPRRDDYRHEFRFNHPDAHPDIAELGAVGLLGSLTYLWPMLRTIVESSRRVVVHNDWLAREIADTYPAAVVQAIDMGVPEPAPRSDARQRIRSRHGISEDAVVFLSLGKVTPEKRIREAMRALAAIAETVPEVHLLITGETVEYYDLETEADTLGIRDHVSFAGYAPDTEIADHIAASDVCLCMRWPTSRETSASWLRCLAGGRPTISTDLVHTVDVPTLDPRNWAVLAGLKASTTSAATTVTAVGETMPTDASSSEAKPVGVSIDILDESHSLKLAIRRLALDEKLRTTLGKNARDLWAARFNVERMVAGYQKVIGELVVSEPHVADRRSALPFHLRATGAEHAELLVKETLGTEYHLRDAD
jgi:glycosyltransferase involved in cell wall biosynthesis